MRQSDRALTNEPHTFPKDEGVGLLRVGVTMGIRLVVIGHTELFCRAEHPSAKRINRFAGVVHRAKIGDSPFLAIPTGRILKSASEVVPGMIPAYCSECRLYTEYEVVAPEEKAG